LKNSLLIPLSLKSFSPILNKRSHPQKKPVIYFKLFTKKQLIRNIIGNKMDYLADFVDFRTTQFKTI